MQSASTTPPPRPDLTPLDREWLDAYLANSEDLAAVAARAGRPLSDFIAWLAIPAVRHAIAAWDYAQRRARAVRDEADRRVAIDTLKAAINTSTDPVEKRRAAVAILRTLDRAAPPAGDRHRHARHTGRPRRPRRVSDFTFTDPAEAERLLDKERRENDRFEKLINRAMAVTETRFESAAPSESEEGEPPPHQWSAPPVPLPDPIHEGWLRPGRLAAAAGLATAQSG